MSKNVRIVEVFSQKLCTQLNKPLPPGTFALPEDCLIPRCLGMPHRNAVVINPHHLAPYLIGVSENISAHC